MTNGADTIGIQQVARLLTARTGMDLRGARGRWLRDYLRACPGDETRWTPDHLESDQGAFNRLVDRVTVQESYFFREPTVLETVRERVFPTLREGSGPVRAWSAGCAGGEEARTLGMMLFDAGLADRAHVLGTDLASVAVRSARSGVYGRWSLRGVDARTVAARFRPVGDKFAVLQARCAEVGFAEHNLLDAAPPAGAPFDLILCRNVLIYLTPSAVGHVARLLAGSLRPGGWLVTGISDPALGEIDGLELSQSSRGAIYRRVPHEPPGPGRSTPRSPGRPSDPVNGRRRRSTEVPHRAARVPALSGDLPDRWVSSAEHALDDGRPGDAERIARRALTVGSQPTLAHALLIRALAADGRGMDAMDAAEQAVRELPDEGSLRGLQAAALLDAGRVDEARRAARQSLYLDPAEALAHIVLARAAELLGDEVTARRARRNGHRVMRSHAR